MKRILYLTALFIGFTFLAGCGCKEEKKTAVIVLVDQTDQYNFEQFTANYKKDIPKIVNAYTFDQCAGGYFQLSTINDLSDNTNHEAEYPEGGGIIEAGRTTKYVHDDLGLPDNFVKEIEHAYADVAAEKVNYKTMRASKIYGQVCEAVTELQTMEAERKVLVVYSDMLENSEVFRFYDHMKAPDAEQVLYNMQDQYGCAFSDLDDIEVHIVAHHNKANDRVLETGRRFWKKAFTELNNAKRFTFDEEIDL